MLTPAFFLTPFICRPFFSTDSRIRNGLLLQREPELSDADGIALQLLPTSNWQMALLQLLLYTGIAHSFFFFQEALTRVLFDKTERVGLRNLNFLQV